MANQLGPLTLDDLIFGLGAPHPASGALPRAGGIQIVQAVIDSRLAVPGCLFVALRGEKQDGHQYIAAAMANGAVAVLTERPPAAEAPLLLETEGLRVYQLAQAICLVVPNCLAGLQQAAAYWRRQCLVRVIGVTGSVGKTTSKQAIASVLSQRFCTLRTEGNYNNEIGLPLTLLHLTPNHQRLVAEMGMYDLGEISHLAHLTLPAVGVVTNVGPTHLERLGTIERIAQAKAELPQALPSAEEGGVAVLNADDPWVRAMAHQTRAQVFTFGLAPDAHLWADQIESFGLQGIRFRFHHHGETVHASVPMLGSHSVRTALCAAAVGLVEGLSWEEILAGLQDRSAQIRLLAVPGPAGSIILDDSYNACPASSLAALALLDELDGRKVAVLGDMYELGDYETEGHKIVGQRARYVADLIVAVGQLGRLIGEEALRAGMSPDTVYLVETNAQAVDLLLELTQTGLGDDRLLVKGSRGMKMEDIVAALARHAPIRHLGMKGSLA